MTNFPTARNTLPRHSLSPSRGLWGRCRGSRVCVNELGDVDITDNWSQRTGMREDAGHDVLYRNVLYRNKAGSKPLLMASRSGLVVAVSGEVF
jgi:hypothetical protein